MDTGHVAVIGAGYWGQNLVRNFSDLGVLAAVCDADEGRLAAVRGRFSVSMTTPRFEELWRDTRIRAVVIATPAGSHYQITRAALEAGKDVLVEKPLALRASEGRELAEMAAARGRILMVGHLLRYHGAVAKLKDLIDAGALGKIYYVYSNRLNLGRVRTEENILWSFAPHDISAILYLLNEMPVAVAAQGGTYLSDGVPDVTVTTLAFDSGVQGHIFVSWLHPYKEQKLVVVGDRGMAVFDDVEPERKLLVFNHTVEWIDRLPVARREDAEVVAFEAGEPLREECRHFLDSVERRTPPATDGWEGVRVLEVLEACQRSLDRGGEAVRLRRTARYFAHETAVIEEPCEIGDGTKIWHFSHVMPLASIGRNCILGQSVFVASRVVVGDNVKIQNNVSLYTGVVLEDDVFCGPSMVFTNVTNPRSHVSRKHEFRSTLVRRGATLGANCTVVCGHTIGQYAFVAAGAVVTRDVPDFALVAGVPARLVGWMCECGERLDLGGSAGDRAVCRACGKRYVLREGRVHPISAVEQSAL